MKIFFRKNKKIKAFSLIEALVSIALILIAIIAPLGLILNSVTQISQNKNRLIATYLGEEIMEDLKAYRDSFFLACKDLDVKNNENGDPYYIVCIRDGVAIDVPGTLISIIGLNNNKLAWALFVDNISRYFGTEIILANQSFFYGKNSILGISPFSECSLELSTFIGYYCSTESFSQFDRKVKLTKINDSMIKVEVNITYAKSRLLGIDDKSIKIIDYIYER